MDNFKISSQIDKIMHQFLFRKQFLFFVHQNGHSNSINRALKKNVCYKQVKLKHEK